MSIEKSEINGNPNVGLYAVSTKNFTLIPDTLPKKFQSILEQTLKVPLVKMQSETTFIGALTVANQTGIVVSPRISLKSASAMEVSFSSLTSFSVMTSIL